MRSLSGFVASISLVASLVGVAGCSSSTNAESESSSDAIAGSPSITFFDDADAPVTSIPLLDRVAVRITGLTPGSRVHVDATMKPWTSHASFVAGADGSVDTSRDAPLEGADGADGAESSYAGVDADGLFWSMTSPTAEYAATADVVFDVDAGEGRHASATLTRTQGAPGMHTVPVDEPGVVGKLFVPPGDGPHPAILAFGGSEGGGSGGLTYASELVPQGYAVLAIAYFGAPTLPAKLRDVPLEYFDKALGWLTKQPDVDATKLGVIGGSRGGELALLLASRHPELKAVVADAPSAYAWGAAGDANSDAWTSGGEPIPRLRYHGALGTPHPTVAGAMALASTPVFMDDLAKSSPAELEAARIKVERAGASIAMFGGADDQLWPSCTFAKIAMDQLVASGHAASHADEVTCFEGAGHLVSIVNLPTVGTDATSFPGVSAPLALGGTPAGTAHAGRARHEKVRDFLRRTLR